MREVCAYEEEVGTQCCAVVRTRALCEESALERSGRDARTRGRAGGAHVAREARPYEAQEAQVGQAEGRRETGSRDSIFFSFFFYLGLCVTDCGRRLWGDT